MASRIPHVSRRWLIAAELIAVIVLSAFAARPLLQMGSDTRVRGLEFSYLIGSGAVADVVFDATGHIPLWNSWMGRGEPLLENSFSYVNNPFMFLPVLVWGVYDGAKLAVVLHAIIAGLGGWMLAYVIGLKTAGRLLCAFLFAGAGGITGAIGMGFYQMALSQAYVPWVYAGALGTLRRRDRWSIGLFAAATSLLIFAGTFWYVLPTAIGCGLLIVFNIFERNPRGRWRLNREAARRLAWATLLILLISATRLIPQAVNQAYVSHVEESFTSPARDFLQTAGHYFTTELSPERPIAALYYFYTIAPAFFLALVVGRLLIIPAGGKTPGTWRVVIPAALAWLLFTSWGQDGGEFWIWLYTTLPILREWRIVSRMLAAGAPFLIIIAAIWFDDLVNAAVRWIRSREQGTGRRAAALLAALALVLAGALAAADALENWGRQTDIEPVLRNREAYFVHERVTRPDDFISVQEWGFFNYFDHYETLIRTATGNPDYRAIGLPPTLGTVEMMNYPAPESIEYHSDLAAWLDEHGYHPLPRPEGITEGTLWFNPDIPPYAFRAPAALFEPERRDALKASEVAPVDYHYQMDTITLTVPQPEAGEVVVVNETSYPGWRVTVNGQPAALESVGGLIGVRLNAGSDPAVIEFAYRPTVLYAASIVTLAGVIIAALYLLRAGRLRRPQPQLATPATDPDVIQLPAVIVEAPPVEEPLPAPKRLLWALALPIGLLALAALGAAVALWRRLRPRAED